MRVRPLSSCLIAIFGGAALCSLCAPLCYGQGFRDILPDGRPCQVCPELVDIPAGQFTMGSPASELERMGARNRYG